VVIDGYQINCKWLPVNDNGRNLLIADGKTYEVFCRFQNDKYEVTISNLKFSVSVEEEKKRALKKLIHAEADKPDLVEVKSPMPGLIARVEVKEGDFVQRGESLVIIEAMKMENEISAPSAGVVTQIFAKEKHSVEKSAVLMVLQK
jgi:biotin carboxyl carrier protein